MLYVVDGGGRGIRTPATLSRPVGFQDRSLQPDLGIPPKLIQFTRLMVAWDGIEPPTQGFSVLCSTD